MKRKESLAAGYTDRHLPKVKQYCPVCNQLMRVTTASERCACGYYFDYWENKGSKVYEDYQRQQRCAGPAFCDDIECSYCCAL